MTNRRWWGAPLKIGGSTPLMRLDEQFAPDDAQLSVAEPLTVRVRGFMIHDDEDWAFRGDNDIIVVSTFQFGAEPPVQRLHYLEQELSMGWHGSLFHDVVLSIRDLKDAILTLRVQIYDLDGVSQALAGQITAIADSVAVAFPQLARYASVVGALAPGIVNLVDNLDAHDRIIDQRLKLELDEPGTGHLLLQPGYFICFKEPAPAGLSLDADLRVLHEDGSEYKDGSYTVLEIARKFHEHYEWEIDQRIAKLIAELNGKGQSGRAAIDFLRETMLAYTRFKRLERAHDLRSQATRSPAEERLLAELQADPALARYLLTSG